MEPSRYRIMLRGKKAEVRLHMVRYAQRHGNKAKAREYGCSKNTVKLWRRRFEAEGMEGLKEMEQYIVQCRKMLPCYGPKRLRLFFGVTASEGAIKRILKEHGLTRTGRKKYKRHNDLREIKKRYRALSVHQADTKHLYDIPRYYPQMKEQGLPRYQYTIRDVKSGFMVLGYGSECS
ncbi:MAG: helix-turn-helix domain-containing protein [Candidatus Bathyarchaeia archaeon]